jgi:glycosyltransferase involved in cell wall biosynthesis
MTIALDVRYRVASGSSIAIQNLATQLVGLAPAGLRFITVRYRDQAFPPELDALEAVVVPRMRAPLELIWNEVHLPGLLARKKVELYHGMKQCAPYRLRCSSVHTVDAIKRGSADDLPLPLSSRLYLGWHVCSIYKRSDHLLPVSGYVSGFLTKELGIDPERMTVVYNGIGEKFLNAGGRDGDETGSPLSVDAPYIVCVGSVIPLKNQLAVVEALAKIADRVPHHLAILGREDPVYAQQVREAAEAGGISDRLHWVGFLDNDGMVEHLCAADAMVHVSRTEGFCLATGEGMACGLPLVLTDRGALREQCGDAALYIDDPDDHDGLAEVLERVLTEPGLREAMKQRGLARVAPLGWSEAARKTLGVYSRVLESV